MGSLCLKASATWEGIFLAEGLHDWGGRTCSFLSYTLAFALQLSKSMENLGQSNWLELDTSRVEKANF
jgi:hypothetical protein